MSQQIIREIQEENTIMTDSQKQLFLAQKQENYNVLPDEGYIQLQKQKSKNFLEYKNDAVQYVGNTNVSGKYEGKGSLRYSDGSVYEGNFLNGLKSGQGVYTDKNGVEYNGEWLNDMKHGRGQLKYPSGEIYKAQWEMDRLNGKGVIIDAKGNRSQAVWYYDMMVPLENQSNSLREVGFWSFFLWCVWLIFFIMAIENRNTDYLGLFIALTVFSYIFLFLEACQDSTYTALLINIKTISAHAAHINTLKGTRPYLGYEVQNYHYETRSSGSGRNRRTRRVRVNTYKAEQEFVFKQWTDTSADAESLMFINHLNLIRFHILEDFHFAPQIGQSYEILGKQFEELNGYKDNYHDFISVEHVPGLNEQVLVFNNNLNTNMPWYTSRSMYVLFMIAGLSWIQRYQLMKNSTKLTYTVEKHILN